MSVLWCGGEDINFPTLGVFADITTAGTFRSGWARCSLSPASAGATAKSNPFAGGAVTSAWLSCQYAQTNSNVSLKGTAFGLSGGEKGLGIGTSDASGTRLSLFKYDGATRTQLAAETGNSLTANVLVRIDMQVISYGATATVNVYVNNASVLTFTGDVTVSGMTNFDSVFLYANGSNGHRTSEIIVSDSDTRAIQGLQVLALTGAGTTNGWTNNTYTNINGIVFSDANPTSVNTTGTDQQYNVTDPTPSVYTVLACQITARMAKSAAPTPTQVILGYNSGGTVAFGTGATKAVTTAYATYEQIDHLNPITAAAFLQSEMAGIQLDLQSA